MSVCGLLTQYVWCPYDPSPTTHPLTLRACLCSEAPNICSPRTKHNTALLQHVCRTMIHRGPASSSWHLSKKAGGRRVARQQTETNTINHTKTILEQYHRERERDYEITKPSATSKQTLNRQTDIEIPPGLPLYCAPTRVSAENATMILVYCIMIMCTCQKRSDRAEEGAR